MRTESVRYGLVDAGLLEQLRDRLARGLPLEELDSAAAAEAMGAQPSDSDPHRVEGVRRQG
jgi:hypothetical protein